VKETCRIAVVHCDGVGPQVSKTALEAALGVDAVIFAAYDFPRPPEIGKDNGT
jgi:isocitrate/isopropylmalate dehydrogenase